MVRSKRPTRNRIREVTNGLIERPSPNVPICDYLQLYKAPDPWYSIHPVAPQQGASLSYMYSSARSIKTFDYSKILGFIKIYKGFSPDPFSTVDLVLRSTACAQSHAFCFAPDRDSPDWLSTVDLVLESTVIAKSHRKYPRVHVFEPLQSSDCDQPFI